MMNGLFNSGKYIGDFEIGPAVTKWPLSKPYNMCLSLCKWYIDLCMQRLLIKVDLIPSFLQWYFYDSLKILCRILFVFAIWLRGRIVIQNTTKNLHVNMQSV